MDTFFSSFINIDPQRQNSICSLLKEISTRRIVSWCFWFVFFQEDRALRGKRASFICRVQTSGADLHLHITWPPQNNDGDAPQFVGQSRVCGTINDGTSNFNESATKIITGVYIAYFTVPVQSSTWCWARRLEKANLPNCSILQKYLLSGSWGIFHK